ncbi:MAG: PAS domain-containing protein, partial [Aggregatilineales bacterium]
MSQQTIDMKSIAVYEYLFHTTDNGILITDATGKITHMNPAAAAMLGVTVEDVVGKSMRRVFYKNRAMMNLYERQGEQKLDVRLPRRRLAQGISDTLDSGDRILILQDVTERRDIENRREMLSRTIA